MRNTVFLLIITFLFAVGCTKDENGGRNIRIKNSSMLHFDTAQVGGEDFIHTNVAPGDFSEYLEYESAYGYSYIKVKSGSETYILQPIDFVGEIPLEKGFHTYYLNITDDGDIQLNYEKD